MDRAEANAQFILRMQHSPPSLEGMTQELWSFFSAGQKMGLRSTDGLTPQLASLEGFRVEVIDDLGEKRCFIVGRSTGWRPCHLEIKTRRSSGGCAAKLHYKSVRVLEQLR